ncbi:MAG: nucleotide exchange factor GrpE [Candidatus Paceibacterota bacterium]
MADTEDKETQQDPEENATVDAETDGEYVIEEENDGDHTDSDNQSKDTVSRLREKLKQCVSEKQEYLDGWQRAKADMVNTRKEFARERERMKERTTEEVIASILPVLDSFEMAFADKDKWNEVEEQWRSGVEHIHTQLVNVLKSHGVESIIPGEGDAFSPQQHTSVDTMAAASADQDDTVARCEKTGYRIGDRIIRSANVVVYKSE